MIWPLRTLSAGKGVSAMNIIIAFLVSVTAGVVTHYICKWLDGHK